MNDWQRIEKAPRRKAGNLIDKLYDRRVDTLSEIDHINGSLASIIKKASLQSSQFNNIHKEDAI